MPRVAHGALGVVPLQVGVGLVGLPAPPQLRLDIVELAPAVSARRLPAVLVRRTVLVVAGARGGVRTRLVVVAPVRVLDGRVHGLGRAFAGEAARHRTNRGAGDGADRAADRSADGRTGRTAAGCAGAEP